MRYFLVEFTRHIQFCSAAIVLPRTGRGLRIILSMNTSAAALSHCDCNLSESPQMKVIQLEAVEKPCRCLKLARYE